MHRLETLVSVNPFPAEMQHAPEAGKGLLEKLGAALPVALTAIATAFAGLSSGEMSRAMYWRSAAAQDQAKANDQWSLAAHKRDRSIMMQTTALQLRVAVGYTTATLPPTDPEKDPFGQKARLWMEGKGPPPAKLPDIQKPGVQEVLDAIRTAQTEGEVLRRAKAVKRDDIDYELAAASIETNRLDAEWDPVVKTMTAHIATRPPGAEMTALQASQMETEQRRYRAEASLNQQIGYLYDVRVKVSTVESDRHRLRSENFFYAMLAGQAGATLAALALARKRHSSLWLFAGVIGTVSVGFGAYVYLTM